MRKRSSQKKVREQQSSYFTPLPDFASTPDEVQRAVERNAIKRGVFMLQQLATLNLDQLFKMVDQIAAGYDKEEWLDRSSSYGINPEALMRLDAVDPPISYPYYFCLPEVLIAQPALIRYYRNLAMVSQKVMSGIGLSTVLYESGYAPPEATAFTLARYFNEIVSALVLQSAVTQERHREMIYANFGDSVGGAWRNEIGRLAYVEILTPLILHLHAHGWLDRITYQVKGRLGEGEDERAEFVTEPRELNVAEVHDLQAALDQLAQQRVKYRGLQLVNGNTLALDRQITYQDTAGKGYKIGPDLISQDPGAVILWCGELKGGADPAGSDEHWKTAKSAFDRILEACVRTNRPPPPLSFMATILVGRVAEEAAAWMAQGKLHSVYNLTQMADDPAKQAQFLDDMAAFLGCPRDT